MSDLATTSPVRASFRAALAQINAYPVELEWRPAFMTPLSVLPRIQRAPLPDLPQARPQRRPFAGQALTLAEAARGIAAGSLSAVAVMEQALAAIRQRQAELNAFVYVAPEQELLAAAAAVDAEIRAGRSPGPLAGIPIAVKDLLAVAGMPNTASSPVLADRVETKDASSIRALKAAGAIMTGKTQTHEFALGVTTPQSSNPWDSTRNPGGSSGGSAIAVATGMSLGAMATDTRASVRVPAALCGVVGYKPTFGLVPGDGVIMLSWSLDHVAHMAANVEDAALMLDVLDATEHVTIPLPWPRTCAGLRVGVPVAALQNADPDVVAAFAAAVAALRDSGVTVVEVDTPTAEDFDLAVLMGLVVSRCEAAAYHTAFGERRSRVCDGRPWPSSWTRRRTSRRSPICRRSGRARICAADVGADGAVRRAVDADHACGGAQEQRRSTTTSWCCRRTASCGALSASRWCRCRAGGHPRVCRWARSWWRDRMRIIGCWRWRRRWKQS